MKVIYFIILAVLVCVFMGCTTLFPREDEEFSFQRRNYTGTNLRLDGFYYKKWFDEGIEKFWAITFLYSNGIRLSLGGGDDMQNMNEYTKEYVKSYYGNNKFGWGIFYVENDKTVTETWVGTESGYKVSRREGIILNDTTFVMKESSQIVDGKKTNIRQLNPDIETYYFKQFSPKPSSENNFIK